MHPCNYSVGRFVNAKSRARSTRPNCRTGRTSSCFADGERRGHGRQGRHGARRLGQFQHRLSHRSGRSGVPEKRKLGIFFDDKYAGKVSHAGQLSRPRHRMMVGGEIYEKAIWASGDKLAAAPKEWGVKVVKNSPVPVERPFRAAAGPGLRRDRRRLCLERRLQEISSAKTCRCLCQAKEGYFTLVLRLTLLKTGKRIRHFL